MRAIDITGRKFGRLTVIELVDPKPEGAARRKWRCACECGGEILLDAGNLTSGNNKSCGCLHVENGYRTCQWLKDTGKRASFQLGNTVGNRWTKESNPQGKHLIVHGMTHHPLFPTWNGMMSRCYKFSSVGFERYGGYGINVADHWHDAPVFIFGIEALIGPRPSGYSLDRINPHGDYVEWNIRWSDRFMQQNNRKANTADYLSCCGEH
jgi:hypothetical protein